MKPTLKTLKLLFLITGLFLIPLQVEATMQCELKFDMKTGTKGEGTVTCDKGQPTAVLVHTDYSWTTLFRKKQIDTHGHFSQVNNIDELFGRYVDFQGSDNAVSDPHKTVIIWKRNISLAFSGTREDWHPENPLGEFILSPIPPLAVKGKIEQATPATPTECQIAFHIKVRAELLQSGKGEGNLTCDNGESLPVIVKTAGSWIVISKSKIAEGSGVFSRVSSIQQLFGLYTPTRIDQIQAGPSPSNVVWHKDISLTFDVTDQKELSYTRGQFKILPAKKK
ncbi:MAG: hypothetical protein Q7T03_02635 [Deltaproteobacteria bacterium]|nr:hypothetical protein [Deltaproteobacteria bacterium]